MTDILQEAVQELFIALTTRWRRENGTLAIGVPKSKLIKAGEINPNTLEELLKQIKEKIADLGLELVEYLYDGEVWYAVRSTYACPTELKSAEETTLAVVITAMENSANSSKKVPLSALHKKLIAGKYFSLHQLERHLKNLEQLGYLQRRQKNFTYGPRTLLEFSEEARQHIAEQTSRFIV